MAVSQENLKEPVLQAIETWTTAQHHMLGYMTQDMSTGKRYRYVQHDDGGAGGGSASPGQCAGAYAGAGSANGVTSVNVVTSDASQATYRVLGVYRGSPTDGQYGFIELKDVSLPTTVLVDCSDVPVQGTYMQWNADSELDSITVNSTEDDTTLAQGELLDSCVADNFATIAWL